MKKMKSIFFVYLMIFAILICSSPAQSDVTTLLTKGEEYYRKGAFELAVQYWEQAASLLEPGKDTRYLDARLNISKTYQSSGHYLKALATLEKVLPRLNAGNDPEHCALFYNKIGDAHLALGNIKESLNSLEKAEDIAARIKNSFILASILNNIGNTLSATGDFPKAMAAFRESLQLIEKTSGAPDNLSLQELKSKVLINIARLKFGNGDYPELIKLIQESLIHIQGLPDSYNKASDFLSLSLLIEQTMHRSESLSEIRRQSLNEAKRIGKDLDNARILSYASGYLGQMYEEQSRYSEAITLTRNAIFYSQQYPEMRYFWQWRLGRLLKGIDNRTGAVKAYQDAISTLNPIRSKLFKAYRGQKDIFNEKIKPVYLGLAELFLQENKLTDARDTMELLKTAELQDFFQDECVTTRKTRSTESTTLDSHTAVIYPIIFSERTVLLLMLPDGMQQITIPVDSERLGDTVKRFRSRLQYSVHHLFLEDAKQLYDWLIRPIEAVLTARNIDTLVVAPDGILRLIPFSALHDGSRFLIETYAIATVPALTLTEPNPQRQNLQALMEGLSVASQGFAPLPNVTKELTDINKVMEGKILQNEDYTLKNVNQEFKENNYAFVHIATHGVFGGNPKDTFLLTFNDRLTMDDLEQMIEQSRNRGNLVELLTLSACETALGDERSAFGLAGIAVKAGVVTAIATLWFVDDVATSMTMTEFYRQLKTPEISKAKALQNAQKILIGQSEHWHPAYWAPFLLIGNWM